MPGLTNEYRLRADAPWLPSGGGSGGESGAPPAGRDCACHGDAAREVRPDGDFPIAGCKVCQLRWLTGFLAAIPGDKADKDRLLEKLEATIETISQIRELGSIYVLYFAHYLLASEINETFRRETGQDPAPGGANGTLAPGAGRDSEEP